ncbi:MAG: dihydroneopterin aldolase [Balneolaceae bacterium]|nr:dihydroneopterin aldolase [Balneolaceae bacterium]MCH8549328.1 dihydroneopterin aldolase [Balneolaceae bacterium]
MPSLLDRIRLNSLSFRAPHGYYESEREKGNDFEVDLEASGHFRGSVNEDDLKATFDYEKATAITAEVMNGPSEKLIETLCLQIGERLMEAMPTLNHLNVTVRKLNPPVNPPAASAEVIMEWKR